MNESDILEFTTDLPELTLYDEYFEELKPPCHNVNLSNMESHMYEYKDDEKSTKPPFALLEEDLSVEDGPLLSPSYELSFDIKGLLEKTDSFDGDSSTQLFPGLLNTHSLQVDSLDTPPILSNNTISFKTDTDQIIKKAADEANITNDVLALSEDDQVMPEYLNVADSHSYLTNTIHIEDTSAEIDLSQAVVIQFEDQGSEDAALPEAAEVPCSSRSLRNNLKATPPSKSIAKSSRRKSLDKNSEEYRQRRDRNNVAVRKSRDKAKEKQKETDRRVKHLSDENERLQKKCDLLAKELNVLKGLFVNVGANLPAKLDKYLS